ncbi:MAG: hypothetical protein PWP07_2256, partial [Epulopiscium sp.]|nr:hypothetical protein [Candidatus Epulonipiscium sp.]
MPENNKIDSSLELILNLDEEERQKVPALQGAVDTESKQWEVIVKYHGDLNAVGEQLGAEVEILTEGYGIITLEESKIPELSKYTQIEFIERP